MQPQEFAAKWKETGFGEKQASQEMFLDICALVDHPSPVSYGNPEAFTFEKSVPGGIADAYFEDHFGWEFKGNDTDLDGALNQLLRYQVHLRTPPLLIVSSFRTIRIQTNFPGMATERHEIPVAALDQKQHLDRLRWAFHSPVNFRPNRTVDAVTRETADLFYSIVQHLEQQNSDSEKLARYLNQIMFCLYAEDADLLPDGLFSRIVRQHRRNPANFDRATHDLFRQMATGGLFGADEVAYFNGDLFSSVDTVEFNLNALEYLEQAARKDWHNIEPSILGTLFERALDASKRSQLGAHYTSAADIELVVEPVVMDPLRREWEAVREEVNALIDAGNDTAARRRLEAFRSRLASVTVLDPACGSGNFLYTALRSLLNLEKDVIDLNDAKGWEEMSVGIKPSQMKGLEINPYAAELARTALWIGYIQWHQANGLRYPHTPILDTMDTIRQTDAILADGDTENPRETEWPAAEFIIGNPPFLGGKLLRSNLGDEYVDAMFSVYRGRVPAEADIVCYWFENARAMLEKGHTKRAGLLATQGIRGGANRRVLQRVKESGDIFLAWSDQPWTLEGAAVHVSIVGFDDGSEAARELDGEAVPSINANLTSGADLTAARRLNGNLGVAFMGDTKGGPFDIPGHLAREMLAQPNPDSRENKDVVRPRANGKDITSRPSDTWVIDFGVGLPIEEAALFEGPFEYAKAHVRSKREQSRSKIASWWIHERPRPEMREGLKGLCRYIVTPTTAKHRLFVWLSAAVLPDHSLIAIARDDDYTFGVLHSRFHEVWARAMGTQLREAESGMRYTPTTCFETFPFPEPDDAQRAAITEAAARLNDLRERWLNPPNMATDDLKGRTLTNLYNWRPTWLANVHADLDAAVAAAYGWPADLSDAEILERLLSLNLERAAAEET